MHACMPLRAIAATERKWAKEFSREAEAKWISLSSPPSPCRISLNNRIVHTPPPASCAYA